jgi:hypothetical protein
MITLRIAIWAVMATALLPVLVLRSFILDTHNNLSTRSGKFAP